jgi:chaperone modulatory protein CbpM
VYEDLHVYRAETDFELTLGDLARCCELSAERLLILVDEGILEPRGSSERDWRFDAVDLARARCARRLERDLGLNAAGIALALELLEESRALRSRVRLLEALLGER